MKWSKASFIFSSDGIALKTFMEDVPLSPFYTKTWKTVAETAADSWGFYVHKHG